MVSQVDGMVTAGVRDFVTTVETPLLALVVGFPLIGALCAYLVGRFIHRGAAGPIATFASALSFCWVLGQFLALEPGVQFESTLFTWMAVRGLSIDYAFRFDHLSAVMCLVVTGIGTLIHLYSCAYMKEDPSVPRFFAYLNLFMFSMLTLVLGANLPVLFVGWEGVGLCSYLLIGFWHTNPAYAAAGRKAFVVNRIGDAGFLIAMFLLFWNFGTLDTAELSKIMQGGIQNDLATWISLCLFVGAAGKSAQIPLFVWLPDAMAGPTPVSALIHAATMVTAGIYLMARLNGVFSASPEALALVTIIALLTAFVAATTALTQNDIKKVLAYSTVSQLGFMFMAASAGAYWVALFHVVTHAFFKACLFLGAGSVIHGCHHEQDMRRMGGLRRYMPITFITYAIATIAIAGIFPFAGYQSKHAILEALAHNPNPYLVGWGDIVLWGAKVTAILTAFYMGRSLVLTFFGEYRGGHDSSHDHHHAAHAGDDSGHQHDASTPHESPWHMTVPLLLLALLSLGGGLLLQDDLRAFLGNTIPVGSALPAESVTAALLHSWGVILGLGLAFLLYLMIPAVPRTVYAAIPPLSRLFDRKWYFDEVYGALIVKPLEGLARGLWKFIDQGVVDRTVNWTAQFVDINGEVLRTVQTGQVRHYALFMFIGCLLILIFCFLI